MKAKVQYTAEVSSEIIDLEDWGYEDKVKWSDLTDEQQHEILDCLIEMNHVSCSAEDYSQ